MKSLLVDAGNSSIKWAILNDNSLSSQQKIFYDELSPIDAFKEILKKHQKINVVVIVSVLSDSFIQQVKILADKYSLLFQAVHSRKKLMGITNAYDEPHKLGTDRLLAMVAAYQLNQKQACLVIDAGTATTIDAVDKNGKHLGGLILPGSALCHRSLLDSTALLPQWDTGKEFSPELFSKETTQAISSASILGLAGAIENICSKMEHKVSNQPVKRFLCGGNAKAILPFMESHYDFHEDLLMQGLKIITQCSN